MIVLRVSQFNVVKKCKMEWYAANVKVQQRDKQQCATSHGMQGHWWEFSKLTESEVTCFYRNFKNVLQSPFW